MVLAGATFAAVRSANTAARTAERSLMAGLRPLIVQGRPGDPPAKAVWQDRHHARVEGGRAHVELTDDVIYLAMSIRNAGAGIALLNCYDIRTDVAMVDIGHRDLDAFKRLTIDLYVPPGDSGYWEGAVRDDDSLRTDLEKVIRERDPFSIDLLYGDQEGGQRTVSRFVLVPFGGEHEEIWYANAVRHWNIDRPDPR